jgi:DsbC/DsbD-like thiol-disulfide interchange protein
VCEKICLPARAALTLDLPSGVSGPYSQAISAARAQVPATMAPVELGTEVTALEAGKWRLCFAADPGATRDAFFEAPRGFWLTAKADGSAGNRECFSLQLRDAPAEASGPIAIRVTLVGTERSIETAVTLRVKK